MIHIPTHIVLGFQKRDSRGNILADEDKEHVLGFATYRDEKGLLKSENSFNGWRDTDVAPLTFENIPTEGFRIAGSVRRSGGNFGSNRSLIRIDDPRGFQLELNVDRLIEILYGCTLEKGEIRSTCVWAWDRQELVLVPTIIDLYKEAIDNTLRKNIKISLKDVKVGNTIQLENGTIGMYCGNQNYVENIWNHDDIVEFNLKKAYFIIKEDKEIIHFSSLKVSRIVKKDVSTKEEIDKQLQDFWILNNRHHDKTRNYNWGDPRRDVIEGTDLKPIYNEIYYSSSSKLEINDELCVKLEKIFNKKLCLYDNKRRNQYYANSRRPRW